MVQIFQEAKKVSGAVVVHVQTDKGRGYLPAELNPDRFHGTGAVCGGDRTAGEGQGKAGIIRMCFSAALCRVAAKQEDIVAITAAMADGTGLKRFRSQYPERFFDVGIAEGHAVTFAAGMAAAGLHPVFSRVFLLPAAGV